MLTTARGKDAYTIYLTNHVPAVDRFFQTDRAKGRTYDVVHRDADALSVAVPLEG